MYWKNVNSKQSLMKLMANIDTIVRRPISELRTAATYSQATIDKLQLSIFQDFHPLNHPSDLLKCDRGMYPQITCYDILLLFVARTI